MTPHTLASEATTLFTLPDVVLRAKAVMDSPTGTAQELVKVIELDAGMAARVLRMANSVLYGHAGRVETLQHAVALIGHNALRDLLLASAVTNTFRNIPEEFVDMNTFWDNSITCAVFAQQIARRSKMAESESAFLRGLLHGVGRLVFYARRPDDYRRAIQLAQSLEEDLAAAERAIFGFCYAELGAALLAAWGLPEKLSLPVQFQLVPEQAPAYAKETALLHLANAMTEWMAPSVHTRSQPMPFPEALIDGAVALGLDLVDLDLLQVDVLAGSLEIIEIIHPNATTLF